MTLGKKIRENGYFDIYRYLNKYSDISEYIYIATKSSIEKYTERHKGETFF